jgi:2-iminobutanoate/2-iminopropanoate deaminase
VVDVLTYDKLYEEGVFPMNMTKLPFTPVITKGNLVFVSGQVHLKDGVLLAGSIEEQTHQVMKNVQQLLESVGCSFKDVVKAAVYTTDMSLYARINEVYITYLHEPFPARELVGVKELPLGARIEISVVAVKE